MAPQQALFHHQDKQQAAPVKMERILGILTGIVNQLKQKDFFNFFRKDGKAGIANGIVWLAATQYH